MSWISVAKPTSSTWTFVNPQGKEQYDQPSITYDSATVFYDGVNQAAWSSIAKPTTIFTWNNTTETWNAFTRPWESPQWTLVVKPT